MPIIIIPEVESEKCSYSCVMEDGSNETSQNEGRCHTSQVYRGAHDFLQCHPCYTYGVMALTTRYPAFGAWDLQSLQLMEWYARRVFSLKLLRPEEHVIQDRVVTSRRYLRVPGHCTSSRRYDDSSQRYHQKSPPINGHVWGFDLNWSKSQGIATRATSNSDHDERGASA